MTDLVPAGGADPVATEIATIESKLGDRQSDYWSGPAAHGMQERYLGLLRAKESGGAAPASPSARDAEILKLEKTMNTDRAAYNKSPAMQDRLLALYREREGAPQQAAQSQPSKEIQVAHGAPLEIGDVLKHYPAAAVAEWSENGQLDNNMARAQGVIRHMVSGIGDEAIARELRASFDVLPEAARVAVYKEVGRGSPTFAKPADDAEMAAFSKFDGGAAAKALGPRGVGIALARFDRMRGQIPAADLGAFDGWTSAMTARERVSVLWSLAHGK